MTRRLVWISLLALAFLTLAGAWFMAKFERVAVEEWTPPAKEARRNPHLALERFMAAMGRPLTRAENTALLDALPAGGILLLDKQRRAHMSPARVERLLDWVRAGGYLIVAPEGAGVEDPVLEFFKVNCGCNAEEPENQASAKKRVPPQTISVTIPGASRPLLVDFLHGMMTPGKIAPDWRAGAPGRADQILHFRHGSGQVTMISGLARLFDNQRIGQRDHAELLWILMETYQPDRSRPVILMTRLTTPKLSEWLAESAWMAMASAAVLLLLWLWSIIPRFGQLRPEPEAGRRQLIEHLAAMGRYVWRAGGSDTWLEAARESFRGRLALRHPALLALPPPEQAAALAQMTRRPASLIAAALHQPARSPQAFTLALRTLRNLERTL